MFSSAAFSRGATVSLRSPALQAVPRRAYAAVASSSGTGSATFETGEVGGVKMVSRDTQGPTTRLAVVVRAGSRHTPPGTPLGLQQYAFKNTYKRSALRIQRETELLGGQVKAYHTREALVIQASFLRADLPYFAELLAEVITQTRYTTHELHEEIEPIVPLLRSEWSADPTAIAEDAAHSVAFHDGLGTPFMPPAQMNLEPFFNEWLMADAAQALYVKKNIAVVADDANREVFHQWAEKYFASVPDSPSEEIREKVLLPVMEKSKYYGGEQRIHSAYGSSIAVAFPTDPSKPEFDVVAALLGGQSSISWSPGFTLLSKATKETGIKSSARNLKYSDAGLMMLQFTGDAFREKSPLGTVVPVGIKALETIASGVSKDDVTKAIAKAKFDAMVAAEEREKAIISAGLAAIDGKTTDIANVIKALDGVSADQVKAAAKSMLDSKASVATVGDIEMLPYADKLGLKI